MTARPDTCTASTWDYSGLPGGIHASLGEVFISPMTNLRIEAPGPDDDLLDGPSGRGR
jgi:hypothetical protein